MTQTSGDRAFPKGALLGAAALIGLAIMSASAARLTRTGPDRPTGTILSARDLRFEDRPDGSIVVRDADTGRAADVLAPGTNGFIRASLRSLATRRRLNHDGDDTWHLVAWADGRLTLDDRESGGVIDLEAFGETNEVAFARLLTAGRAVQ